jgi:hypothetical protein
MRDSESYCKIMKILKKRRRKVKKNSGNMEFKCGESVMNLMNMRSNRTI